MTNFKEGLQKVKAFIFDVDGVLSSPRIFLDQDGELMRTMNTKDGYAIQHASGKGYPIAIITGGRSESIALRFKKLGLSDVYLGSSNKMEDFEDFLRTYNLTPGDVLYMGDDLPDYEVMKKAGVACCPADAVEEIKSVAHYISHLGGGEGCVRDVIEQVLRLQGRWMDGEPLHW
jgi:3-deoxy-D-manno-octulosonate 8-phosphate phosphatase (KDO 8-P phosphatase)